jgi:integrase
MATGIRRRHSKGCPARDGGRCRCKAGFEASVYVAREGRKVRKTFERESEAKAWRAEASTAAGAGKLRTPSRLTVEQAAWLWLEAARTGAVRDRSGNAYKPGTLREYGRSLRLRILPEFGAHRLTALRRVDLQAFVDRELAAGPAASTIANALNPLQAIYRHALRRELVAINPTRDLDLPAANGRRERIASAAEAARLIEALPAEDRALWATAFYAGLRRGELRALAWADVDLGRSEIRVERAWDDREGPQAPKSEAGRRTVPILAVLRDFLDALKIGSGRDGEDLVFGVSASEPFSPSTIRDRAARAWKRANKAEREAAEKSERKPVPLDPITLHECRHTFASLLIDAGVNAKAIQTFMGHATIQMTFDQYGKLMPGSREQARELVDAYLDAAEREARAEAAAADPCASRAPVSSVAERLPASGRDAGGGDNPHP